MLGTAGPEEADARIEALIELDVTSWTAYREPVWELAAAAHDGGLRTAILSNGVPEIMARVARERPLGEVFDAVIVSCEVGCAKPDRAIFALTLERLGVSAAESLFVDDRLENVEAARQYGLQTLHFDEVAGVEALRQKIRSGRI